MWSRVRDFAKETGARLHGGTGEDPRPTSISLGDQEVPGDFRRVLLRELRTSRSRNWLKKWTSLAEQGGLAQTFSQTPESNFWIRDCRFMRYREYRFAIKARLNLLPVAAHKIKYGGSVASTRCKGCTGNIETQEHMLNVCPRNMPQIKARHDKVMERQRSRAIWEQSSSIRRSRTVGDYNGRTLLSSMRNRKRLTWSTLPVPVRQLPISGRGSWTSMQMSS